MHATPQESLSPKPHEPELAIAPASQPAPVRRGPNRILDAIEQWIGNPRPRGRFILRTAALSLFPTVLIVQFLRNLTLLKVIVPTEAERTQRWFFFQFVYPPFVAPWFETLVMVLIFGGLRVARVRGDRMVWASALIWAGLHWNAINPFVVVPAFWGFLVYSKSFIIVSEEGRDRAVVAIAMAHMVHNLAAFAFAWPGH